MKFTLRQSRFNSEFHYNLKLCKFQGEKNKSSIPKIEVINENINIKDIKALKTCLDYTNNSIHI